MKKPYLIVIGIVVVIISFLFGLAVAQRIFQAPKESIFTESDMKKATETGYQQAEKDMKNELEEAGVLEPLHIIVAQIVAVDGNELTVEYDASSYLFEDGLKQKIAVAGDDIVFERHILKSPTEFFVANKIYEEASILYEQMLVKYSDGLLAEEPEPPEVPLPHSVQEVDLKDLKVGEYLTLNSTDDIRQVDRFQINGKVVVTEGKQDADTISEIGSLELLEPDSEEYKELAEKYDYPDPSILDDQAMLTIWDLGVGSPEFKEAVERYNLGEDGVLSPENQERLNEFMEMHQLYKDNNFYEDPFVDDMIRRLNELGPESIEYKFLADEIGLTEGFDLYSDETRRIIEEYQIRYNERNENIDDSWDAPGSGSAIESSD